MPEDKLRWMLLVERMRKKKPIDKLESEFPTLKTTVSLSGEDAQRAADELEKARKCGAEIVTYPEKNYPEILKFMSSPPPYLYVKGDAGVLNYPLKTSILGSRRASLYGISTASAFGHELSDSNICVMSGGARGIDTAALNGALRGTAPMLCITGAGLDNVYPKENAELFDKVAQRGAVVTQFPFGTPPLPGNFPVRNRVMAMLSDSMVIVEAAERSGALISASCANEMGKTVFAVPGNIDSPLSMGTNALLRDGAMWALSGCDIIYELMERLPQSFRAAKEFCESRQTEVQEVVRKEEIANVLSEKGGKDDEKTSRELLTGIEKAIINAIKEQHHDYDSIMDYCACSASSLTAALTLLEMKNILSNKRGRYELM